MAKRTILVDDLDGSELKDGEGGTVTFAVRGEYFEIDLSAKNQTAFDKALAKYIDAATKVGAPFSTPQRTARKTTKRTVIPGSGPDYLRAVREWARSNGYEVNERGRVKAEIVEAYEAAHK